MYTIVRSNRLNSFKGALDTLETEVIDMFEDNSKLHIIEKELLLKCGDCIPESLYNRKLVSRDTDLFIVFDGHVRIGFLKWLKINNPHKRIILWLWNTVSEIGNKISLSKIPGDIEVWSYSEYDCRKYNLRYNTTFYWQNFSIDSDCAVSNDVYFIGKDKGRLSKILKIKEVLEEKGAQCVFHVAPTSKLSMPKKHYSKPIPYNEVLMNIARSKAILDIQVDSTAGPSLRALEAAFYKKKLITDDIGVKAFKFYSKKNIFILGEDDLEKINDFINSPFEEINTELVLYYSFLNWIKRFVE